MNNNKNHKYFKFIPYFIILFMVFFVFRVFFFSPYNGLYLYYDDAINQILRFYQQMWETVHVDGLHMWDFSNLFGANYIASNAYYNLFSPFTIVIYFFDKGLIGYELLYINMFKLLCMGIIAYQISKYYTKQLWIQIIVILMLMFNGWVFGYAKYLFMWDAYVFMLVIIWGIERILNGKSSTCLFIGTAILGITNYYFLYMFSFLVVIYFGFRFFILYDFKNNYKIIIKFIIVYFLGIIASMVIFLPAIVNVISTPRFTDGSITLFASLSQLARFFTGFFAPAKLYGSFNGYLDYRFGSAGWNGGMTFYSMMLTPLLLPQLFNKVTNEKKKIIIMYCVLSLFVMFIPVYYLFQQSLESRWFIIFVILNTYMVARVLEIGINKKLLIITYIIVFIIPFIIKRIVIYKGIQDIDFLYNYVNMVYDILIFYGLGILGYLLHKNFKYLFVLVMIIEIGIYNPLCTNPFSIKNASYIDSNYGESKYMEDLKENINVDDRVDYLTDNQINFLNYINLGNAYNISSFTDYHSIYNYQQYDYLLNRFVSEDNWYFYAQNQKYTLKNELGLSYIISTSTKDDNLFPNYIKFDTKNAGVNIYKSDYPLGLVQLHSGSIDINDIDNYTLLQQDVLMRENVFVNNPQKTIVNNLSDLTEIPYYNNMYYINANPNDVVYVEKYNYNNVGIDYYLDDSNYNIVWNLGYVDFPINKVTDYLTVSKSDVAVYKQSDYNTYLENKYASIQKNITLSASDNDYLKYQINADSDSYLATAIAYDKGWSIYIDNKKVETLKINNGFIGAYISEGKHTVEFRYVTPYLLIGAIISLISMVFYVIYRKKYEDV